MSTTTRKGYSKTTKAQLIESIIKCGFDNYDPLKNHTNQQALTAMTKNKLIEIYEQQQKESEENKTKTNPRLLKNIQKHNKKILKLRAKHKENINNMTECEQGCPQCVEMAKEEDNNNDNDNDNDNNNDNDNDDTNNNNNNNDDEKAKREREELERRLFKGICEWRYDEEKSEIATLKNLYLCKFEEAKREIYDALMTIEKQKNKYDSVYNSCPCSAHRKKSEAQKQALQPFTKTIMNYLDNSLQNIKLTI